ACRCRWYEVNTSKFGLFMFTARMGSITPSRTAYNPTRKFRFGDWVSGRIAAKKTARFSNRSSRWFSGVRAFRTLGRLGRVGRRGVRRPPLWSLGSPRPRAPAQLLAGVSGPRSGGATAPFSRPAPPFPPVAAPPPPPPQGGPPRAPGAGGGNPRFFLGPK